MVKFRSLAGSILCCLLVALGACSPAAKPKVVEKAVEPVTGLHALAQMFSAARGWQADVLVLRINSINAGDIKSMPGRSGVWQGTFVSPTAGQSRTYTFSVSDISTSIRTGIFPDPPATYSTRAQTAQPFNINGARKDTDEVYETAIKHAAEFVKSHPDENVSYVLELNDRAPDAMWRVYWGTSLASSPYSVLIDAASGDYYRSIQ
jgi:hypothetical protein